jgi:uncharacterized protein (UPF0332 family)
VSEKEARELWARAKKALETAKLILSLDPDSSASRSYYAAFYAVSALFALQDQAFSKHAGLQAAVNKELVKTGQWPKELGRAYSFLMDLRDRADYGGDVHADQEEAQKALDLARRLLQAVRETNLELFIM